MYAQVAIKPNPLLRNGHIRHRYEGCAKMHTGVFIVKG